MKVNIELNEKEADRYFREGSARAQRVKQMNDVKKFVFDKRMYLVWITILMLIGSVIFIAVVHDAWYNKGYDAGVIHGQNDLIVSATTESLQSTNFEYAFTNFVKFFMVILVTYWKWFAAVIAIAWLIHGVGFKIL